MENLLGISEMSNKEMAEKMHSEVFPLLSLLNLNLHQIKQDKECVTYIEQAESTLLRVKREIRDIYNKMSSFFPGRLGLGPALANYFCLAASHLPVHVEHCIAIDDNISGSLQHHIYRLVQRLTQIIVEDEGGDEINISIEKKQDIILMKIWDNRYKNGWRRIPDTLVYPMYPNLHYRLSAINGRIMAFLESDNTCCTVVVIPLINYK